jgi:hypothetical protein
MAARETGRLELVQLDGSGGVEDELESGGTRPPALWLSQMVPASVVLLASALFKLIALSMPGPRFDFRT